MTSLGFHKVALVAEPVIRAAMESALVRLADASRVNRGELDMTVHTRVCAQTERHRVTHGTIRLAIIMASATVLGLGDRLDLGQVARLCDDRVVREFHLPRPGDDIVLPLIVRLALRRAHLAAPVCLGRLIPFQRALDALKQFCPLSRNYTS